MRPYSISLFAILTVILISSPQMLGQTQASCNFTLINPSTSFIDIGLDGINDYGTAVGSATDTTQRIWGLISYGDGTWKIYQVAGHGTQFASRNNSGVSVGSYAGINPSLNGLAKYGTTVRTVNYPGSVQTQLSGINYYGTIVGHYQTTDGRERGFQLKNGSFTSVNFPGAYSTYTGGISDS